MYRPLLKRFYYDETRFDTYLEQLGIVYPTLTRPISEDDRDRAEDHRKEESR